MSVQPLDGSRVLVTGGTGSFGDVAIGRILEAGASELIVYSRDEYKQFLLRRVHKDESRIRYVLGDVRDATRLDEVMSGVDVVVHAAAMKHIDACEDNPIEAVMTNVIGAHRVLRVCCRHGVRRVVNLSADKATMPSGVYGATKLLSERAFSEASEAGGRFRAASVRYSNALGSRGSVVEVFQQQLRAGKPITVFDPRMVRLVLTQHQVVDLVFYALERMLGGEVFIKDSPAVKIVDLARAVAELCGGGTVNVGEGAARAGERYEALLLSASEAQHTLRTPDEYYVILPEGQTVDRQRYVEHHAGAQPIPIQGYGSDTARVLTPAEVTELLRPIVGAAAAVAGGA